MVKIQAADPGKAVPDKLSVIDLQANPPRVIATLEAGAGASGVPISILNIDGGVRLKIDGGTGALATAW